MPISPAGTNLFDHGTVTMDVTLHGFGPDVVIEVVPTASTPIGAGSRTALIAMPEPAVGCVIVQPTGLDSRVQDAP